MSEIIKDLDSLHEKFRPIARAWLRICYDDIGLKLKVTETLRTPERQAELQKTGASRVRVGWHQYGLAFDFLCFDPKTGALLTDGSREEYHRAGLLAQALGCVWGGTLDISPAPGQQGDFDHIEYHPGFTLVQYQSFLAGGPNPWTA